MLNVGLTGNIAAGKSTVVDLFKKWGATVIDADILAREAQAPGSTVLAAIARRFGADVLSKGELDRAALRAKVIGDNAALADLNSIVHPAVQQRRLELQRVAAERGDAIVVNDIPLLFEVLNPQQFDALVLVDAPVALRRTRLRSLRGLSNEDADRMITAQMPAERKRPLSQFVIENAGTVPELERRAQEVFAELRKRAARAGVRDEAPGQTLLLCALDAKDAAAPVLQAIQRRYTDAGIRVEHTTVKALSKVLQTVKPLSIVATVAAAEGARRAWETAVPPRPCRLYHLSPDPDPIAVRLDLRPWGHDRIALSEEDGAGLAPRGDLL
jgi:dephospho-CoA kinase